jgi:CBS domain-containing protein
MALHPEALDHTASVAHAAEVMREMDVGSILVYQAGQLLGILTDRDIVVRVLARGGDPRIVTLGECCSRVLTMIAPTATLPEAERLMQEKAIRRLIVVENDASTSKVVGVVSLGDLARARDRESVLGYISAAIPNT